MSLLELPRQLGNVSQACKILGYSRGTFNRCQRLYETGGEETLREVSKRKPMLKKQVAPETEQPVVLRALDRAALGQGPGAQ